MQLSRNAIRVFVSTFQWSRCFLRFSTFFVVPRVCAWSNSDRADRDSFIRGVTTYATKWLTLYVFIDLQVNIR